MTQGAFFRVSTVLSRISKPRATTSAAGSDTARNYHGRLNLQGGCTVASASLGRRSMPPGKPEPVVQPGRERPRLSNARLFPSASPGVAHAPAFYPNRDRNTGGRCPPPSAVKSLSIASAIDRGIRSEWNCEEATLIPRRRSTSCL